VTGAFNSLVCSKRNLDAVNVSVFVFVPVLLTAFVGLLLAVTFIQTN
jgi:hypothetical protein